MKDRIKIDLIGLYLLAFFVSLIATSVKAYYSSSDQLIRTLVYIGVAGGLGGTIFCIRSFYKHLISKDEPFDLKWTWWYIFRPFISIAIGEFVYFLIVGGLLSVGSISQVDFSKSVMFYCALAFLGGFSFTQFANKLEELASTVFASNKETKEKEK
jgi:hypothetical protein